MGTPDEVRCDDLIARLRGALARDLPPGGFTDAPGEPCPAAVLVPLIARGDAYTVLLTRRSADLADHAGQICFPGGRIERGDASPRQAALREAEEEVGLPPERVELLGELGPYHTGTGFVIAPQVGRVGDPPAWRPDPVEVAEVLEIPLDFLLDPANHRYHEVVDDADGRRYRFHAMPYGRHFVWGATAGILKQLYRLLAGKG